MEKTIGRIIELFEELEKEGVQFCLVADGEDGFDLACVNGKEVKECRGTDDLDREDPRRNCAYVDSNGDYVEPDSEGFNSEDIYFSPLYSELTFVPVGNVHLAEEDLFEEINERLDLFC